jgi:outer membrane receptor protein involved in Fe transport
LIGRFSQYSGNFTFDLDGNVLPAGTPTDRNFATEEYDIYGQDIWKPYRNLTLTIGLRYGLSRPVYEKNGYQIVPDQRLGDVFDRRVESAARGVPNNELSISPTADLIMTNRAFTVWIGIISSPV